MSMPRLSIIVPMLDEIVVLPELLAHLRPYRDRACDIILVDGGSADESVALAETAGFRVIRSGRGRALQMNAGAGVATGDVLLFLHADTRLPGLADALIAQATGKGRAAWGRFDVRIASAQKMLRVVAWMINRRSRLSGIATGDQAIFVTRAAFETVDGFPEQPLMEDIALSRRLKRLSPPACLRARVTTSGRRWETRGVWRTILLMWRLRLAYWLGTPPEVLAGRYR